MKGILASACAALFSRRTSIVLVISALLVVGVAEARAGSGHYTRGDAEAVLAAYPTGGGALHSHASHVNVGPSRAEPDGPSIRPIPPFFSDARYCSQDWHAIAFAYISSELVIDFEDPFVFTRDDALYELGGIQIQFLLDGELVEGVTQAPIQPYLDRPFLDEIEVGLEQDLGVEVTIGDARAIQAGRAVAPEELSIGAHTLSATITHAELGVLLEQGVTFHVDPPDSETCRAR